MKKLHLICNAHLDPVWLWEWDEGAAEAISTFRCAADFCEEYDGLIFNHNEALLYQWVEEYEPALFARIQRLVAEGKWHIIGGWYLQPDCNMPNGESFFRQAQVGQKYFEEKFGVRPTSAVNFDSFGHSRGLVQIMKKNGYDSYIITRPCQNENPFYTNDFLWKGFDGSVIQVHRQPESYTTAMGNAAPKIERFADAIKDGEVFAVLWGVGNHGGGPSRVDLNAISALMKERKDVEILHSTPEAYIKEKRETSSLPTVEIGLQPHAIGCYTAQAKLKRVYRQLENLYFTVEKMATEADMTGRMPYPKKELDAALKDLLFAQFHDILPGSSIQPVEKAAIGTMEHGIEILSKLQARLFYAFAQGQPKAEEGVIPIFVYNAQPYALEEDFTCEFNLANQNPQPTFYVPEIYQDGVRIPTQCEKEESTQNCEWRKKVVFHATVPPCTIARFDCHLRLIDHTPQIEEKVGDDTYTFRNGNVEIVINCRTGLVDSYRLDGREYLQPGAFCPIVIQDNPDSWGHELFSFPNVCGKFVRMDGAAAAEYFGIYTENFRPINVIEDGEVRTVLETYFEYGHSKLCRRYILKKQSAQMEVEDRVFWNEKDKMLKLAIPTTFADTFYGQTAGGVDTLFTDGRECTNQKWVSGRSAEKDMAFTILNDGIYGSDFSDNTIRLSVLRSSAYATAPGIVPPDRYTPRMDQGEHLFRFVCYGGSVAGDNGLATREAAFLNEKPYILSFFPSGDPASLEAEKEPVYVDGDGLEVMCLMKDEEGSYVLRLLETDGVSRTFVIRILGREYAASIQPCEIKTFVYDPVEQTLKTRLA